jgi:hypothetical protein
MEPFAINRIILSNSTLTTGSMLRIYLNNSVSLSLSIFSKFCVFFCTNLYIVKCLAGATDCFFILRHTKAIWIEKHLPFYHFMVQQAANKAGS